MYGQRVFANHDRNGSGKLDAREIYPAICGNIL